MLFGCFLSNFLNYYLGRKIKMSNKSEDRIRYMIEVMI